MSDSQKPQRTGATPIKNPLLSASVTGLTYDDFPNKPLLLPAAPPIVHAPVPASVATSSGLVAREPKSLVTVGSSSVDTENLDEINLNSSNEENQSSDLSDPNANPLLEQSNQGNTGDSILSQAASSFSALPSVASNVFSTFSKRITAISSRETTPTYDQYHHDSNDNTLGLHLDIQPTYTQQKQQEQQINIQQVPQPAPFYGSSQIAPYLESAHEASQQSDTKNNLSPPEPPKFYTPGDFPSIPSANAASANLGSQNNFRFSSKKKLYAPIPGLSDQSQNPSATLDPSAVCAPISYGSSYGGFASNNLYQQSHSTQQFPIEDERKPEERKIGSGLFSKITNLAPTSVLQNITGLVQSAAGSLTQTIKSDSYQEFNQSHDLPIAFEQENNYFTQQPPPPPTNYFVPPSQSGQETKSQSIVTTTEYSNISETTTQPSCFFSVQQPNTNLTELSSSTQSENFLIPQPSTEGISEQLPASILYQNKTSAPIARSQPQIPFFNPSNLPSQIISTPQPPLLNKSPSSTPSQPSSLSQEVIPSLINSAQLQPIDVSLQAVPTVGLFDPTKYLLPSNHPSTVIQTNFTASPLLSAVDQTIPPPTGGCTSYRLQKGTKLYKNPLKPQETAPIHVLPNQIEAVNQSVHPTYSTQQALFSTASNLPQQSVPLFSPTVGELKSNEPIQSGPLFPPSVKELNLNEPIQSIPLFATTAGGLKSIEPTQSVPLFPPVGELKSEESIQSVPLFPPSVKELKPNEPIQSPPLFPPPVGELKSNEPIQSGPLFVTTEDLKSKEPIQSVSFFSPTVEELKPNDPIQSNENIQTISLVALPKGELKSSIPIQSPPLIATLIEELQSNQTIESRLSCTASEQLKTNEPEQSGSLRAESSEDFKPIELLENDIITEISKHDTNLPFHNNRETQPIFEPIETVAENDIRTKLPVEDQLEQTLQKLSLSTEAIAEVNTLILPPISTQGHTINNPYRRGSGVETSKPAASQPTLANFFTPESSSSLADLNFFATLPATEPHLEKSNSAINFFSKSSEEKETKKQISESTKSQETETSNLFDSETELGSSISDDKSDFIPVEPQTAVYPPISAFFPTLPTGFGIVPSFLQSKEDTSKHFNESLFQANVPPPIGFESFIQAEPAVALKPDNPTIKQKNTTVQQETTSQPQKLEVVNRFSNYFNQTNQPEISKDPSTFFDSFAGQTPQQQIQQEQQQQVEVLAPGVVAIEEQRIQHFFNNPPPKDASAVGDLNYDLVHSGLGIKNLQQRSLTPISNLVEPPSSACSEFSEISNSTVAQRTIEANPSITESSEKSSEKEGKVKNVNGNLNTTEEPIVADISIKHYEELPEEILKELRMANLLSGDKSATTQAASVSYKPAVKHWFFERTIGDKQLWVPFSHYDSALLETSLQMEDDDKANIVAVEGGRYDVNINERKKLSVYWDSEPIQVRRCSWFYKTVDSKYVPYEEQTAEVLENEYKQAAQSGVWHKTIILGMGEQVVFHGPTLIVHFQQQQNADAWGGTTQTATRPRVVKRDLDDFNIEQGESQKVDHLLFMVHGIGSACDLKLRSVEEVVEDFRTIARQLVQSHYKNSTDLGLVGRVEVLPISWHSHLHSVEMGIDEKLRMITLESIPKLRNFTNDTLLDILFYTSPTFCQKIMNTIVSSLNSLYLKYRERHPEFNGGVSLAGHSLGSLILFDLLCHQNPIKESEDKNLENPDQFSTTVASRPRTDSNQLQKQISYTMGPAGTGQPFISYSQLIFQPKKFFALGSPIGMFVTIRGIDKLGLDFRLPTCPGFYNIFHPYDPVAYRIEALVNPDLSGVRPVLIPHHKGRKRMHLELKETMTRVSMDLKNRFLDKFKTTLDSVNIFGSSTKSTKEAEELMEKEVDKVIEMQIQMEHHKSNQQSQDKLSTGDDPQNGTASRPRTDSVSTVVSDDVIEIDFPLGKLNDSKRIDYVLQEAPLEFINEYIFALSSHVCYWDSEDTILFVMKEIYSGLGISPDSQVPQQTMTIERPSSRNSLLSSPS